MNCRSFQAGLHDYFHGSSTPDQKVEIDQHASQCGPCGELMRVAREISCRDFVTFLDQYIDDLLPPDRKAVFERHLAICPDCTAYIDSYRKAIRLSRQALRDGDLVPPDVPEGLLKAILAARQRK